ncbi:MAG: response regulator [Tidjanibacter sp.]|nr:response regulator [Tidjanibacter sp.]MBR6830598.1 response regulator [Tidjanibacter sp.]
MKKILIAVADRILAEILRYSLRNMGAEIDVVDNEDRFVNSVLHNDYVIVLTQFSAPFLNGYDLVKRIKSRSQRKPIIYLISHVGNETLLLSLFDSGVDQYITLPLSLTRLKRKLSADLKRCSA